MSIYEMNAPLLPSNDVDADTDATLVDSVTSSLLAARLAASCPPPLALPRQWLPRATSRFSARAGVLLALMRDHDRQWRVLLTRRAALLASHAGEVALPGGKAEHDESVRDAALREAHEEVHTHARSAFMSLSLHSNLFASHRRRLVWFQATCVCLASSICFGPSVVLLFRLLLAKWMPLLCAAVLWLRPMKCTRCSWCHL